MAGPAALLACDWGTTNLRAWTLDAAGQVVGHKDFDLGVSKLKPGEAAQKFEREVQPQLDAVGLPAILCGMVGSTLGWTVAPYAEAPAGLPELAGCLAAVAAHAAWIRIVPGVRCQGPLGAPDVMRGEETQLLGWVALHPERARGRHVVCHPGTHAKWVLIEDGRIVRFVTAMTGELFAVLSRHSVLKGEGDADDAAAFHAGLEAAGEGEALAARLFTARARVVGGDAPAETTPAYLSGLLIGAEAAAMPSELGAAPADTLAVIGDLELGRLYQRALQRLGRRSELFDGELAAQRGLLAMFKHLQC